MSQPSGITDAMRQYEKSIEEIMRNKPKRSKAYGIKLPDSINVVAMLAGIFFILVAATALY